MDEQRSVPRGRRSRAEGPTVTGPARRRPCLLARKGCRTLSRTAVTLAVLLLGSGVGVAPVIAQDEVPVYDAQTVPLPAEAESTRDFRVAVGGADATAFASESRVILDLRLAPMPASEIEGRAQAAIGYLRTVTGALSETLIRYRREETRNGGTSPASDEILRRAALIKDFETDLVNRADILIQAAEAKGADMSASHAYVDAVAALTLPEPPDKETPTAEQMAHETIRQVREEPPVHERPQPWTVPVVELVLELQPLQRAELEERVDKWLQIVERQVRERIRIDLALKKAKDLSEKDVLARMANDQQAVITATVARVQAALTLLAKRGGDTGQASQYIANATGQRIDLTDPAVFYAQAKAWALSESGGIRWLLNMVKFLAILFSFWVVSWIIGAIIGAGLKRLPKSSSLLQNFLVKGVRRVVMLVGVLVAVSALGINVTPLAAAIGAAGLVVGLALQGTLSNFASGILILFYRPFDVGDIINAGGVFGKVDAMTLVSTRVLTFDNQVNWVPNNAIWNNVITNTTALATRRVDMTFGIGYADDMAKAQSIIEAAVTAHPKVLESPAPTIKVNELGDSSVNFIVRPWSRTGDYWEVYWDLVRTIKERFDEEGINIPFPQRDLHLSGPIEVVMKPGDGVRLAATPPPPSAPRPSASTPAPNEPGPPPGDDDGDDATSSS